jgi:hypothetical protein
VRDGFIKKLASECLKNRRDAESAEGKERGIIPIQKDLILLDSSQNDVISNK